MLLTRYATPAEFLNAAAPFLTQHEAEHCLLLGLAGNMRRYPDRFDLTPAGLYLATVEQEGEIVAAALRTPPHPPTLSLIALEQREAALRAIVAAFVREYPDLPGVSGPAEIASAFVRLWCEQTGAQSRLEIAERIFKLETVIPVVGVPGQPRPATAADRDLLVEWVAAFQAEAFADTAVSRSDAARLVDHGLAMPEVRGYWLWEDEHGMPVSLAGYTGPTPHGMRVAPVYTPPAKRGHGYASTLVAALSQHLLDTGRQFCFLFTDLANPTSNKIYQNIGYRPVIDFDMYAITF